MNNKDFKWTEKRFGLTFANILKKLTGLSKDSTDGSIEYKDEQGNVNKLVTDSNFSSLLAKNGLIEIKWQELKDKRDNGQLIPGSLYRITDYNCTTTQEDTRSAGHQFDIVLLALSENKLAEEGWAMMHDNIYDVAFSDGVTKKCWIYCYATDDDISFYNVVLVDTLLGLSSVESGDIVINEENKTAIFEGSDSNLSTEGLIYNYFQNSNLSAWKVWYCLDNDKSRFAWADDSIDSTPASIMLLYTGESESNMYIRTSEEDRIDNNIKYYGWAHYDESTHEITNVLYTIKEIPEVGDTIYRYDNRFDFEMKEATNYSLTAYNPPVSGTGLPNGRGVIYRLIDEWGNDCPYDFKNILYVVGEQMFAYTFSAMGESPTDPIFDASIKLAPRIRYNSISIYDIENNTLPNIQFVITASDASVKFNSIINSRDDVIICSYANDNILRNCHGKYQMEEMNGLTFWNCVNNYSTTESPFYISDAPVQINSD